MSFPMDEIGLSDIFKTSQANINITGNVQSLSDSQSNADKTVSPNADVSDTLNLSNDLSKVNTNSSTANLQNTVSMIDTASNGLTAISGYLNNIKQDLQTVQQGDSSNTDMSKLNASIKEQLVNIENTAKSTSFNKTNLLDGSNTKDNTVNINEKEINPTSGLGDNTLKGLGLPGTNAFSLNSTEEIQTFSKQIDQSSKAVVNQQAIIEATKDKAIKAVGSLVVIGGQDTTAKAIAPSASNVQDAILKNPQKNLAVQTKSLDTNLLLAMLSLQK